MSKEMLIPIPASLLERILRAFLDMASQGAKCKDANLMEDVDKALAKYDARRGNR